MMNLFEEEQLRPLEDGVSIWREVRRIADQLELTMHLAELTAGERRHVLVPRLTEIADEVAHADGTVTEALLEEIALLGLLLDEAEIEGN